jgi:hypothetical protein
MSNTNVDSGTNKNLLESDPIGDLIGEICIVILANGSFCARLIATREDELWFESRSGQKWMASRKGILSMRPLHRRC